MYPFNELVGVQEISMIAGVSSSAVANWRSRFSDFPTPLAVIAGGPVFHAGQVKAWLYKKTGMGGTVAEGTTCFVIGPMRYTLHRCTIQIGEHGQLPFDISAIRTLKFARTPAGLVDARKKLEAAVAAAVGGEFDAVTATRLWNPTIPAESSREPVARSTAIVAEDDEPGFLEFLSEMERALPELNALFERRRSPWK